MDDSLLEQFFEEECNAYVCDLILAAISQVRDTALTAKKTFDLNRFEVTIDLGADRVLVEDVLEPEGAATAETTVSAFAEKLGQIKSCP